jgi:hypothetical protein
MALRPSSKDVQNESRTVTHLHTQKALQVTLLHRTQRLIKYNALRTRIGYQLANLFGFPRTHEQGSIRGRPTRRQTTYRTIASRLRQLSQLIQCRVEGMPWPKIDSDQNSSCA